MDTESTSSSTTSNSDSSSYGSGMFVGSQNFTVAGGTFTNVTNNYTNAPTVPYDLRMIPLGDIDLQQEIRLDNGFAVVNRRRETARVRCVYSARVHGGNSNVTVAMYQGDSAEVCYT
ncbi:hypothetical protein B0H13DRAFT_2323791 [Mycena leptocephala]|nr:hypothetical protein B0H13DRAFT_2323791 [Mycena leptocephala]